MKLLITGANGFLGRYIVAEALARGHFVRAMVRSDRDVEKHGWDRLENFEFVRADLRSRDRLTDAVRGVDCALHLAASKSGDIYAQLRGTVVATENLLWAMEQAGVKQIVGISSMSVYDYLKIPAHSTLDEQSPIEVDGYARDEYARTKLLQEKMIRQFAAERNWPHVVLRPGVIWGKDNFWTARLGIQMGAQGGKKRWLRMGATAQLPLTYVENCAQAIVIAAEKLPSCSGEILNVIDDETPTQKRYAELIAARLSPRPRIVPIPFTVMQALAGLAALTNRMVFENQAKIPGIFVRARLLARCKPLRFDNGKIKRVLGWLPKYSLNQATDRTFAPTSSARPSSESSAKPQAAKESPVIVEGVA
jgi:2-alkyl-3-oxoalkanoate reductase